MERQSFEDYNGITHTAEQEEVFSDAYRLDRAKAEYEYAKMRYEALQSEIDGKNNYTTDDYIAELTEEAKRLAE